MDKKSNEITAIPELIRIMELSGCTVTIDAMGCQKEIVKLIAEQDADYIITLKKNQGQLYKNVEQLFKEAIRTGFSGIEHSTYCTKEQNHGREGIRHYLMLTDIDERVDPFHKWQKLIHSAVFGFVKEQTGRGWSEHISDAQYQEAVALARQFLFQLREQLQWRPRR